MQFSIRACDTNLLFSSNLSVAKCPFVTLSLIRKLIPWISSEISIITIKRYYKNNDPQNCEIPPPLETLARLSYARTGNL